MNEDLLHYIWKYKLLREGLHLTNGEELVILHPGEHNFNAGPDFLNSRIRVGSTTWAGNVEIHIRTSDWYRHEHQWDDAYRNIILHVVYDDDALIADPSGQPLLTLIMKGKFDETILQRYEDFTGNRRWIPCEQMLPGIDKFYFSNWSPALAVERLMRKSEQFRISWESCKHDWDECFYQQLSRSFGFRINSDTFEMLAASMPLKIITRNLSSPFRLESLFYGQAGLLSAKWSEEYPQQLLKEYDHLREMHSLVPLQPGLLRFLRLRPSNFPTIRISQFCNLLNKQRDLFGSILEIDDLQGLYNYFMLQASSYWDEHFIFGKISPVSVKNLGRSSAELLIMNFVIPFLFFYGEMKQNASLRLRALDFLEKQRGEMNNIILGWKNLGMPVENALHTQALLQLKNNYCDKKRCLECRIGRKLISS